MNTERRKGKWYFNVRDKNTGVLLNRPGKHGVYVSAHTRAEAEVEAVKKAEAAARVPPGTGYVSGGTPEDFEAMEIEAMEISAKEESGE